MVIRKAEQKDAEGICGVQGAASRHLCASHRQPIRQEEDGMPKLFEPAVINAMALPNRFVRSATWEGMATEDGACTPKLTNLLVELARGGVGLIITGHAYVRQDGQAGPWQLGIYEDELVPGLQAMTDAVHAGGGKVVMQLNHAGIFANSELTGQAPMAPSKVEGFRGLPPREMTTKDIHEVVQAFGRSARRAKEAGFDGVQIHSAHGYLLSQFLSPVFNHRLDKYGGTLENRARTLLEALQAIRERVGPRYPVLVKLNCQDFTENGLGLDDSVQVGVMLAKGGIDAIELSGGLPISRNLGAARVGINAEDKEAYFRNEARTFKEQVRAPLILVGGIRSYYLAERLVEEEMADYVSMSRPLIREPALISRWRSGDLRRATCVSDNKCFRPVRAGEGVYCVNELVRR